MLLVLVLVAGLVPRVRHMADVPLWVDEAETSLNALTILSDGVPRDTYLGQPIFENTLTEPWLDHPEFEFRDSSYSDKGLAIYHGWLPLYALAMSFSLHGVEPDHTPAWTPRHSREAMFLRTRAARTPAIVFSTVFLIALFFAARRLCGMDGAWAALAAGTVSAATVAFARQARYYSVTLALSTLCCVALCLIVQRGRWRDFLSGAAALVLLFHANTLAALAVGVLGLLVLPFALGQARILPKLLVSAAVLLAGTAPWVFYTGFLQAATNRPMARELLSVEDVFQYPLDRWPFVLLAVATMVWLAVAPRLRGRIADRLLDAFIPHRAGFLLLGAWVLAGFASFVMLIPAASYFTTRLTLLILVPSLLFGAMLFAALARVVSLRHAPVLAPLMYVAVLGALGKATFLWPAFGPEEAATFQVIEQLREVRVPDDARLYATAGDNLVLRFYTGMPFQSVIAVRKEFFDTYPGDIIILESPSWEPLTPGEIGDYYQTRGESVSASDSIAIGRDVSRALLLQELQARLARAPSPLNVADSAIDDLVSLQRNKTRRAVARTVEDTGNPMFRGYDVQDYSAMWQLFFYRFVSPESRMGPNLNYAERIREAEVVLLPHGWMLFRSVGPAEPGAQPDAAQESTPAPE